MCYSSSKCSNNKKLAADQRNMAAKEAKWSRVQARSVAIFTGFTIVFLPLSFFTSYFGMDLGMNSSDFWTITRSISLGIIVIVFVLVRATSTVQHPEEGRVKKSKDEVDAESSWSFPPGTERYSGIRNRLHTNDFYIFGNTCPITCVATHILELTTWLGQ